MYRGSTTVSGSASQACRRLGDALCFTDLSSQSASFRAAKKIHSFGGAQANIRDQRSSMNRYTGMLDYIILYYNIMGVLTELVARFWDDWVAYINLMQSLILIQQQLNQNPRTPGACTLKMESVGHIMACLAPQRLCTAPSECPAARKRVLTVLTCSQSRTLAESRFVWFSGGDLKQNHDDPSY